MKHQYTEGQLIFFKGSETSKHIIHGIVKKEWGTRVFCLHYKIQKIDILAPYAIQQLLNDGWEYSNHTQFTMKRRRYIKLQKQDFK